MLLCVRVVCLCVDMCMCMHVGSTSAHINTHRQAWDPSGVYRPIAKDKLRRDLLGAGVSLIHLLSVAHQWDALLDALLQVCRCVE